MQYFIQAASLKSLSLLILASITLTGCIYNMPSEDHVCTVPTTNNPNVIKESGQSWLPGVSY